MSIDWITVVAQIVNFVVLIWLLKRFLYRPILDGIDAREAEIAARMSAATEAEERAQVAEREFHEKLDRFEAQKTALLKVAGEETENERKAAQLRIETLKDSQLADWSKQKADIESAFVDDLRAAGAGAILTLTSKALKDLADEKFEERIVGRVESQLKNIGADLREAAGSAEKAVAISSFPLSKSSQNRLANCLRKTVSDVPLSFLTDKEQSPGIALRFGGAHVGWTIDTYLEGLKSALDQALAEQIRTKATAR